MIQGIRAISPQLDINRRKALKQRLFLLITHQDYRVRAAIPGALSKLAGENVHRYLIRLLMDNEWIVRANSARAITRLPGRDMGNICKNAFRFADQYGREVLLRAVENREDLTRMLRQLLETPEMMPVREWLLANSYLLRTVSQEEMALPFVYDVQPAMAMAMAEEIIVEASPEVIMSEAEEMMAEVKVPRRVIPAESFAA